MMPEISLNILDVAQNSVTADSTLTVIKVAADTKSDRLETSVTDNGRGMTAEQVKRVIDPFYTTRTTRKVGLGVPFFKMAAEITGGEFSIESTPGVGTCTRAIFCLSSIDRMPLGDIASTMVSLIGVRPDLDFVLDYSVDDRSFVMDTREFKEVLGGISLGEPEVQKYIMDYINEGVNSCGIV
jgi:hypothetical protein